MAGHSKWANIKHRKAAQDAKKGKVFTKLIRELTVAARNGSADPSENPRLRTAIDKALGANMKRDTVDKAIARGAGGGNDEQLDELVYEGYGPNGVAILIECMTDNVNRTVANVRAAFTKAGGNLGTNGSVAYLFESRGVMTFEGAEEEVLFEAAIDAGAQDVVAHDDGVIEVVTAPEDFHAVMDALASQGYRSSHAELDRVASTEVELDEESGAKIVRLIDVLEDLDDAQNVYHNAIIPESCYS
ncbi:YebC/PmpR family DNA-binding transcriptional regulator [Pokkaliibacter sp. CJK22405]|uniref:YebC/PmpR family DNA-binding transcriptional regulator n=1 Tax=Pokkaliibacter sp. CJK22405 TaxID=3384615 RepID=UPI003984A1E4